jgi:carboxyl-terminal processing protease
VTLKRGIVVRQATGGSSGQTLTFPLPGGGSARICVKRDLWPDGSRFVGVGTKPDVEVSLTVASVRNGTDPVLEAANARLR